MTEYIILILAIATSAGFLYFSYRAFAKKRLVSASSYLLLSLPALAFVALLTNTIMDDSTIKRLTREHAIATIEFRTIGKHHYRASFTKPHAPPMEFEMRGDQWQIDARVMKWNGLGAKMGLKPIYQFERLSGRYQDVQLEKNSQRSVYALSDTSENTEDIHKKNKTRSSSIWDYLIEYQEYIPWLDSQYGSATYMPMENGAIFTINLSQNGLIARPRNFVASQSVKQWL